MRRPIILLATAAWLILASVGPASAAAPDSTWIPSVEFDDPYVCEGSPVLHITYTAPFRLTTFTDRDGNVVRDATGGPAMRIVLADESTGRSLSGASPAIFRTTYAEDGSIDRVTVNGLNAAIAVPGSGLVLLDTGTIVWDGGFLGPVIGEGGTHALFGSGDHEAFCDWYRS